MHKNKYLEERNSIIQWIISQQCMELLHAILHYCTVITEVSVHELFKE